MEREIGGMKVYETALECARNEELKEGWIRRAITYGCESDCCGGSFGPRIAVERSTPHAERIIAPMVGTGTINTNDFSVAGLLVSFLGSIILLAIVNLTRRRGLR
jgi:hypothetical protein